MALADFGLARSMMGNELETKNGAAGTPAWMAPEVLRSESVTRKADVFSFGVVMWEVLTGMVPWKGKAYVDIVRDVGINGERLDVTRVVVSPEGIPLDEVETQTERDQMINIGGGPGGAASSHGHLLTSTLGNSRAGETEMSGRATLTASTEETRCHVLASESMSVTIPPAAQRSSRSQCAVLIGECFRADPAERPDFAEIVERLGKVRELLFELALFEGNGTTMDGGGMDGMDAAQARPPPLAPVSALETKSAADSLTDYDFEHDSRQRLI